jgi:hypothetical protein
MATTTPNYLWSVPTSSDLVKNGATAIETLGDSVDASLWNSGYGQAGKNKVINGDFNIWQRGTTGSSTDNVGTYVADRWLFSRNGTNGTGTNTISRETFTVGQTDVPNNPTYYCRWTTTTLATSQTRIDVNQYVENVSTFAGQTATLSFYIKSSGTFGISTFVEQNFGSGGSTTVTTTTGTGNTSTSWQRFTTTIAVPSITGKTVGASNYLRILIRVNNPTAGATFDYSNVQIEYGSYATPFQTATGTLQGELAACQRYYERRTYNQVCYPYVGQAFISTAVLIPITYSEKRGTPTLTLVGTWKQLNASGTGQAATYGFSHQQVTESDLTATTTGMTAGNASLVETTAGNTYIEISAEL